MSGLVFRPRRFTDKNGDTIKLDEMRVIDIYPGYSESVHIELDNGTETYFSNLKELEEKIQEMWDLGVIIKGKNVSKELREKIRMLECLMEAKGKDWTVTEQMQLDMFRDSLRRLQEGK